MKTEIYLTKEFLQHINNTVQPMPGNEVVILIKDNGLKVFNKDEQGNYVLAIYKPNIQIIYAPVHNSNANDGSNNSVSNY